VTSRTLKASLLFCLLVAACEGSEERKVKNDFLKDYPNYTVISVERPQGYASVVTFHIGYKKTSDPREYWADWAYERKNGELQLVTKGTEHIADENSHP
jgi:hypothetical protein